eukprot:1141931-Pleurochrysis_carterae.AAC.2
MDTFSELLAYPLPLLFPRAEQLQATSMTASSCDSFDGQAAMIRNLKIEVLLVRHESVKTCIKAQLRSCPPQPHHAAQNKVRGLRLHRRWTHQRAHATHARTFALTLAHTEACARV